MLLADLHTGAMAPALLAIAEARGLQAPGLLADVESVTRWARTGEADTDALARVVSRLFRSPSAAPWGPLDTRIPHPTDPTLSAVALAVMAARGRARLASAQRIEPRELAALLSVDESWVRAMARRGQLTREGKGPRAPISAVSAVPALARAHVPPWG